MPALTVSSSKVVKLVSTIASHLVEIQPTTEPVVRRVTERRIGYFASPCVELGFGAAEARRRGTALYLGYPAIFDL